MSSSPWPPTSLVSIRQQGDLALLEVKDHGMGIAAQDQERIFERFERAVSEENDGGFGLGLWIARQVVHAHGGRMSVQSASGQGATFTVELPLTPAQEDQAYPPGQIREEPGT